MPRGKKSPPPPLMAWVPTGMNGSAGMRNEIVVAVISYALYDDSNGRYQLNMMIPAPRGRKYPTPRFQTSQEARQEAERLFEHWIAAIGLERGPQAIPRVTTTRGH